jgi:hypothetical protein
MRPVLFVANAFLALLCLGGDGLNWNRVPERAGVRGAQAPDGRTKFEVASIKPAPPGTLGTRSRFTPGGNFTASNISLKELIALPCAALRSF